jgi:hypothetical protein
MALLVDKRMNLKIPLAKIDANSDEFLHGRSCMGICLSSHRAS